MRATVCAIVAAIGLAAQPAFAQPDRSAAAFWKTVQATCNATAAKPASERGQRIARTAIDEFNSFGGHRIDSNGRLFHFGLTEAEHEEDDGGAQQVTLGHLGWWQVMKYWRALFADDPAGKIEVRGYDDASADAAKDTQAAAVLRTSAADLMRAADAATDPEQREILREAALRAAIVDTPWSAAFISYVVRQSGVAADAFAVLQRASRLYLRRFRGERGRTGRDRRRPGLSRLSADDEAPRRRHDLPAARAHARRCQRRGGARAHPRGTRRRHRRALGPAHPLRDGRVDRCAGAQGVHHRRQRQSGGHRPEDEPAPRHEVLGRAEGPLRRCSRLDLARGQRRGFAQARPRRNMLAQRREMVRAAAVEMSACGFAIILPEISANSAG